MRAAGLEGTLRELSAERDALVAAREELSHRVETLTKESSDVVFEKRVLLEKMTAMEQSEAAHDTERQKLTESAQHMEEQCRALAAQIATLRSQNEELDDLVKQLQQVQASDKQQVSVDVCGCIVSWSYSPAAY